MNHIKSTHNPLQRFLDLVLTVYILYMTLKGGTSGACAACKYQRRRCAADCPLAPYFPAEQPKLFQNVHRLFGVRSIVKILENLDEAQKPEAMKSIIFQSYVRERNPVHGCLAVTQHLQNMIWFAEEELKAINAQLQLYRSQDNNNQHIPEKQDVISQLDLGMRLTVNNNPFTQKHQPQMSYTGYNNGYSSPANTDHYKENLFAYHHHNNGLSNRNEIFNVIKSNNGVMVSNQYEEEEDDHHGFDELHPFLKIMDDGQEACASSSGESLKEPINEIGQTSASTCFSLTNVN